VLPELVVRRARLEDLPGLRAVWEASLAVDDLPGIDRSDIDRGLSRIEPDLAGTAVALLEGVVAGACTPRHDDLTVHPAQRRRGIGRALFAEALAIVRERGLPYLQLYVPPHLPTSLAFAAAVGLRYHSSMWLCRLRPEAEVPEPLLPDGFVARTFSPDEDLEQYVALMNDTFADHPTPVSWSLAVVRHVHSLPDFDPTGICLVSPADDPDRPVAFTKVEVGPGEDGVIEGWIGQIGVLPAFRGRGLGRELLRWGIAHARVRGAVRVELSVETLNERALELYRRHGFDTVIEWPHYVLPVEPLSSAAGEPSSTATEPPSRWVAPGPGSPGSS
jgi:mycothiol synthase